MRIGSLTIFGIFISLAACKADDVGDAGGDGDTSAAPITEEEFPETAAEGLCELTFECSCESAEYPDEAACVETRRSILSEEQQAAQAAGLIYDAQCAGDWLASAGGCVPQLPLDCDTTCPAYHGELGVGMACTRPVETQSWSDCARGLWCQLGICRDPCGVLGPQLGAGDACRDEMGQLLGECNAEPGLRCDYDLNVCIVLPGVGEPCYSQTCGPGAVCDIDHDTGESICKVAPGEGEACTDRCEPGLYCDSVDGAEGTCVAFPVAGEPCWEGACKMGHICNEADTCESLPAWVCSN